MKKYFLLSAISVLSLGTLHSCVDRTDDNVQYTDNDTYAVMRDITGSLTAANNYKITQTINIPATDVVLVYRNVNSNTSTGAVWQQIPKTEFLSSGRELDYNFLFNSSAVEIFTEANFDQSTMTGNEPATYLQNQRFRIVLVPASQGKVGGLDYSDYNAVIKFYNLKDLK